MSDFIDEDIKDLEKERPRYEAELNGYILAYFVSKIKKQSAAIQLLLDESKNLNQAVRPLIDLVAWNIVDACDGNLIVPEYVQSAKSRQTVYLFIHTHWVPLPFQVYNDFITDAALRIGLPEMFCYDVDFINKLRENVANRLARHPHPYIPDDEVWINFKNGTLVIDEQGTFRFNPHNRDDFLLYALPYWYNEGADCPMWTAFLNEVLPNPQTQQLLAEAIGYCFTRHLKLEKMFVFYGSGSNGKSVVLDTIEHLLGRENVSNMTLSDITTKDEKRSLIENKLVNISHESAREVDPSILKQLVSGEPTDVRVLYRGTHTMYNYGKLFTSFNKLPQVEHTHGFFRRWIIFPFIVTIPEERQDADLARKFKAELAGILNWVLATLPGLLSRKAFTHSAECDAALSDFRRTSNSALSFFADRCVLSSDHTNKLKDIYIAYKTYCDEEGYKPFGKKEFQNTLRQQRGVEVSSYANNIYYNIQFRSNV